MDTEFQLLQLLLEMVVTVAMVLLGQMDLDQAQLSVPLKDMVLPLPVEL
jgi:hypothetical protein